LFYVTMLGVGGSFISSGGKLERKMTGCAVCHQWYLDVIIKVIDVL
jgi:hypothetical protein